MRDTLGWLVLIGGTAGLGAWSYFDHASAIEAKLAQRSDASLGQTVHPVSTEVRGRDLIVSGLADSEEERTEIVSRLDDVDGRRVVVNQLDVLKVADPYLFKAVKESEGVRYSGYKPTEASFDGLLGDASQQLILAAGMPDEHWPDVIARAIKALSLVDEGEFEGNGRVFHFSGLASDQLTAEQATKLLTDLPDNYTADVEIGWPVLQEAGSQENSAKTSSEEGASASIQIENGLVLAFDALNGIKISGAAPQGVDATSIAAVLGLESVSGTVNGTTEADGKDRLKKLEVIGAWLPALESLKAVISTSSVAFEGMLQPGGNLEVAKSALVSELGEGASVNLVASTSAPDEGQERINFITGTKETFRKGYWLPVFDFDVSAESCRKKVEAAINFSKINFLSGSAHLDPKGINTINTVSAIVLRCLTDDGLSLEVGGHTDSQGADEANMELSVKRANAVRSAMIVRGVSDNKIQAKGYGESTPIASNETEDGRAENRRTSFGWTAR